MNIIKYSNRKYYNTATHKYVTLKEVLAILVSNELVRVLEYSSNKNITDETVIKAIANRANKLINVVAIENENNFVFGITMQK